VHDAEDMAELLEKMGFDITAIFNAGKRELDRAVDQFHYSIQQGDQCLFYFAGHGFEYDNCNWLQSVEPLRNARSFSRISIKAQYVLDGMARRSEGTPTSLQVMFLDCCREFKGMRRDGMARGDDSQDITHGKLKAMEAAKGSIIGFACSPNELADDGDGERNGIYTKHLLAHIATQGVDIDRLLRRVGRGVERDTDDEQQPFVSSKLRDELVVLC